MSFMQPEIVFGSYYRVETRDGTFFLPADVCPNVLSPMDLKDHIDSSSDPSDWSLTRHKGYLGRMPDPGYLDYTDWMPGKNKEELEVTLKEMYEDLNE